MQLFDSRVDPHRANMLCENPNHFGRIEVIADKSDRLEAVQESQLSASPPLKVGSPLQGRSAALSEIRKAQARDLLEPNREPGGSTLPHADRWNARVENVNQFCIRQTL